MAVLKHRCQQSLLQLAVFGFVPGEMKSELPSQNVFEGAVQKLQSQIIAAGDFSFQVGRKNGNGS